MKIKGETEKWASGVLGLVCLLLLANLLLRNGVGAGAAKPSSPAVHPPPARHLPLAPSGANDDLARYDSEVKVDLLAHIQSLPIPKIERNPFEYPPPKAIATSPGPVGPPLPPP